MIMIQQGYEQRPKARETASAAMVDYGRAIVTQMYFFNQLE
jgi:hypothetical protein